MDEVTHVLHDAGFGDGWHVTPPTHGSTGRAFVARRGDEAVFVKLVSAHAAQGYLAALGVTPPIITHGQDFTISRYVEGVVPDRTWMRDNAALVIDLLTVVQRDKQLRQLLAATAPVASLGEHLAAVVARLIERATRASAPAFQSSRIETALECLRLADHAVEGVPLVPTHTDPSPPNVLVSPERTYLVDWDGIRLSDPLRDVGLILWWFVPPERWQAMLRRFWLPEAAAVDRVYWWAAVGSFRVALWIDRQAPDDPSIHSFMEDFIAAAHGLPNPRRLIP